MVKSTLLKYYPEGTEITTIGNREAVSKFTNVEEEYNFIRNEVGVIDCCTYGIYKIKGEGATKFLDQLATKDIEYLNINRISECYFLDNYANIVGWVFILRFDDYYLVLAPWDCADKVYEWLKVNADDCVEISNLTGSKEIISVEGPKSFKILKEIMGIEIETIPLRGFTEEKWDSSDVCVARMGLSGEYGYAILTDLGKAGDLINELLKSRENVKCKLCGINALELCMLEIRQPNLRYETKNKGNIFELAQQWLIQYDKENFTGYEKLREMFEKPKERLVIGFECSEIKNIKRETKVFVEDEIIGEVLHCIYNSQIGKTIGVILVKSIYAQSGIKLTLKIKDHLYEIKTLTAPYVKPISSTLKME
ncbi:hypothetical protein RBH29_03165 [Herbivorax sp. ANBcel31]|uniref:hypothetical protein n=1 Tax=Herbivorax sp. ANBcel31 TaxID=3069754 RepID=UPI0027ADA3DB|nr:hypothetical protein [Herbivorax sp. ANBcel31]MDQ2085435.1 hypothetical protein [Herbivorax sp. ANBcel31]